MDISKLRQRVRRLDERRRKLLQRVLRPFPMVSGSLYEMRRRCGNPRCKCAGGDLHASWYLSRGHEGRTRLTYIGRIVPDWLALGVRRYRRHQKMLAAIRKVDAEISRCLNRLRDERVRSIEEARRDRR